MIPEDAKAGGNGILIDGLPAMQGSVETRSASEAQPEKRAHGASQAVDGR